VRIMHPLWKPKPLQDFKSPWLPF